MENIKKPITVASALERQIIAKKEARKKKKSETTEEKNIADAKKLTLQEKKLIKQEKIQQVLGGVEKKKRLKKNLLDKEEYHHENGSTIFTGAPADLPFENETQPVNLDDLSFNDIVSSEKIPAPDMSEKENLLKMFDTDVPSEIDKLLYQREQEGYISRAERLQMHNESKPSRAQLDPRYGRYVNNFEDVTEDQVYKETFEATNHGTPENLLPPEPHQSIIDNAEKQKEIIPRKVRPTHQVWEKDISSTKLQEKSEKKPWLKRIKNWFIKDPQLLEDALYDQNRKQVERELDQNIEAASIEKADRDYRESLKREQEAYDARIWAAREAHNPTPTRDYDEPHWHEDSIFHEQDTEDIQLVPHDVAGAENLDDPNEDLKGNESVVSGQYDLAVKLDNQVATSLRKKKNVPRGKIKGFTADR